MAGHCGFAGTAQVRPCSLGRRIHAAHTPQTHSAPPSIVGRWPVDPRHAWMNLNRNQIFRIEIETHPRMAWLYCVDQGRHPPEQSAVPTAREKLSKAGWVRLRGREPHGCGDRAYMGEGALLAKHCFASARTHSRQRLGRAPEGDLQRPPQPDPPRLPTDSQLLPLTLTLTLIRQVHGCKPCRPPPLNAWERAARAFPRTSGRAAPGDGPAPAASAGAGWPGRRHRALHRRPAPAAQNPSRPPGVPHRAR